MPTADAQFDRGTALVTADGIDLERQTLGLFDSGVACEQAETNLRFAFGKGQPGLTQTLMETLFETLRPGGLSAGHRKLQGIHVFFKYREQQRRKIIQLAALFFRKLMGRKRPEDRYFATKVFRSLRRVKMN
ncbi:DNA primase [Pseudomonas syringae pv. actinidiae]|uniref:DNA primase n=1 Tax=Pseudomonas syringae pv. actinidiae TaxID=103796 RepID=A0A2V0Q9R3_PSESF|nr:DNA primase [Pseudomonas syringae pv. actinidiae]